MRLALKPRLCRAPEVLPGLNANCPMTSDSSMIPKPNMFAFLDVGLVILDQQHTGGLDIVEEDLEDALLEQV
jgi:hypothetical protein